MGNVPKIKCLVSSIQDFINSFRNVITKKKVKSFQKTLMVTLW